MAVGALVVNVIANTAKARKDLKSFRGGVAQTSKSVGTASRSFRTFRTSLSAVLGPLVAVAGAAVSFRAFNAVAATMDRTAKVARKLGIASSELAGLRHAAEQTAGVAGGTLDMALQRMTRRVAEAANGSGEAVKALDELGLSAEELNRKTPDEVFRRVAEAMKNVENRSDKVRLAFKLFDSEGVDLVNTLDLGADGLKKMANEAERLGIAFSEGDLAKVEAYNDAMDRLQKSAGGLGSGIVIELAPGLTEWADGLTEAIDGLKSFKMPDNWVTQAGSDAAGATANAYWNGGGDLYRRIFDDGGGDRGQLTTEEQKAHNLRMQRSQRSVTPEGREQARRQEAARFGNAMRAAPGLKAQKELGKAVASGVNKSFEGVGSGFNSLGSFLNKTERGLQKWGNQAQADMVSGKNPFTGREATGMSDARRNLLAEREGGNAPRGLNSLIDANSAEGYRALRANLRGGPDDTAKHVKKTADNSAKTAVSVAQAAKFLGQIAGSMGNANPPLEIPGS